MKSSSTISPFVALAIALLAAMSCTSPADTVAVGSLCLPATADCPQQVELTRDSPGRNGLEFSLYAAPTSSQDASVELPITTREDFNLIPPRPRDDQGALILFQETYPLGADETLREVLGSYDLTVARRLEVGLRCTAGECDHRLDYLQLTDSVECVDDGLCSRGEFCEIPFGRCARCEVDSQCDSQQTCDRETGQCFPGRSSGCQTTSAPPSFVVIFLVLFLLVLGSRRAPLRSGGKAAFMIAFALVISLPSSPAQANTGATISVGGGTRLLTGDAGELTYPGWGITINQQIRRNRFGLGVQIASNSFGLRRAASPERGNISGYGISIGPQFYLPLPFSLPFLDDDRPFSAYLAVDYMRWSVAENRLATVTGLDLNYHALGPTAALTWRWSGLDFTGRLNFSQIFQWPGSIWSMDLLVGFGL